LKAISEMFRNEDFKCDLVTIYFAGHVMVDEFNTAFLVPYDIDPDDPYVSGISMEDLTSVISASQNDASVIMFLDCCFSGRAAQGVTKQYTVLDNPETSNLYATQLKNMVEAPNQSANLERGRGKIILAAVEADAVAREKEGCKHLGRDDPHAHGVFSFHLIEGLDGRAADSDTGVITIGSIRRYIEDQMRSEGKQIPVYYVAEASRIDSIKVAISQQQYNAKIGEIINSAQQFIATKVGILELPDIQSLAEAAKKVGDLISLDPNNRNIPMLRRNVVDGLNSYFEPAINWFNANKKIARAKINEIDPDLYDRKLQDLIFGLNFDELQKIDQNKLDSLIDLCYEVANDTEFKSYDDPRLRKFQNKIRASFRRKW
jgi:Caspase domain